MSRLLIVEDADDLRLGLKREFDLEGHLVECAADGETALEYANKSAFDLILLDVKLPKKSGYQVCRELRQAGNKTPILILSSNTSEAEKVVGLDSGADDYLCKPFGTFELHARVRALLRRTDTKAPGLYRFEHVEADLHRGEIRVNGKLIELTALELKLLALFLQKPGVIFTRDQLIDRAWPSGTNVTHRVVDTHIYNLRKKIEIDPEQPQYIKSIRGLGYRFGGKLTES